METVDKKFTFVRPVLIKNLVRLGCDNDGGYVVSEEIVKNCENLITLGLGSDWSFELDYIKSNSKVKIHVYDHTVSSYPYIVDILKYFRRFITFRTPLKNLIHRIKYYYKYLNFLKLKNVNFFKTKICLPVTTNRECDLNMVFSKIDKNKKVVLKIDIEGSEYELTEQITENANKIKMLIMEFHWIDKNENIFIESVKKLKQHFEIIHIHGNNHHKKLDSGLPIVLEMSLINKSEVKGNLDFVNSFPITGLDFPNNPNKPDIKFKFN